MTLKWPIGGYSPTHNKQPSTRLGTSSGRGASKLVVTLKWTIAGCTPTNNEPPTLFRYIFGLKSVKKSCGPHMADCGVLSLTVPNPFGYILKKSSVKVQKTPPYFGVSCGRGALKLFMGLKRPISAYSPTQNKQPASFRYILR